MKVRKFYPAQFYRRLSGKRFSSLDGAVRHSLANALYRGRKTGFAITIIGDVIHVLSAKELGGMIAKDLRDALPAHKGKESDAGAPQLLVRDEWAGPSLEASRAGSRI